MMPALYDVTRLAKLSEGEERWMLETKAVRDRNRVADALADCVAIIQDALQSDALAPAASAARQRATS